MRRRTATALHQLADVVNHMTLRRLALLACPLLLLAVLLTPPTPHVDPSIAMPGHIYHVQVLINDPDHEQAYLFLLRDVEHRYVTLNCPIAACDTNTRMVPLSLQIVLRPPPDSVLWKPYEYRVQYNPYGLGPLMPLPYFGEPTKPNNSFASFSGATDARSRP